MTTSSITRRIGRMALAVAVAAALCMPAGAAEAGQLAAAQPDAASTMAAAKKRVKSIAGAQSVRNAVWAGDKRVTFESVAVGGAELVAGKDFAVSCFSDVVAYDKGGWRLDDEGRIVAIAESGGEGEGGGGDAEPAGEGPAEAGDAPAGDQGDGSPGDPDASPDEPAPSPDPPACAFQDDANLYAATPVKGAFRAGVRYTAVLEGKGAYSGVHLVAFKARKTAKASSLRLESGYLPYTGKAVKPRFFLGSPAKADREVVPAKLYSCTYEHKLFSTKAAVKKAVEYANYGASERYLAKVAGKGRVTGTRTFAFRVYRPVNIEKCRLTQQLPAMALGGSPEFSMWYPRPSGYGDYVPRFLYTVSYHNSEGKEFTLPPKAGKYTLVLRGNRELGCKGTLRRKVRVVSKGTDISSVAKVKVVVEPAKGNGYKPVFRVVKADGTDLPRKYYSVRYVDYYDQAVATLKKPGAIVVAGRNGYYGAITRYIGE